MGHWWGDVGVMFDHFNLFNQVLNSVVSNYLPFNCFVQN